MSARRNVPAPPKGGTGRGPDAPATIREIVGSRATNGGAIAVERHSRWHCDRCRKFRRLTLTVLLPILKGHSRPRFDSEAQPTFSVCWWCLFKRCFVVAFKPYRFAR